MRHWLMITTVDVLARPNNREHQLLRHLAKNFDHVTVVFRARCTARSLGQRLRAALVPSVHVTHRDGIRYVAVSPFLSHPEGMVRDAVKDLDAPRWRIVSRLIKLGAGPIGVLKDIATIGSLAVAAGRQNPAGADTFCTALGPWAAAAARLLAWRRGIGSWVYEDRDYEPGFIDSPMRKQWAAWLEASCIRASRATISIGTRLASLRHATTGRKPFLIPTGADSAGTAVADLGQRDRTLVYVGNVASWSGLVEAVKALPIIRRSVPDARLQIVGDGALLPALRDVIADQGVEDAVELCPSVPHAKITRVLLRSAIGLAVFEPTPLRVYAMPLKVVEYMAAGLPVITTAATESADVVEHYGCGLAVDQKVDEISSAAIRLLTNPELWADMSRAGVAASRQFEWSSLAEREWDVMQKAAAAKAPIDAEGAYGWNSAVHEIDPTATAFQGSRA